MQYRDRVLIDTPIPLLFKAASGISVIAKLQYAGNVGTIDEVPLTEITTGVVGVSIYVGSYVPTQNGWYYCTFYAAAGDTPVGVDVTRFYSFTAEEETVGTGTRPGDPVLQELQVKIGTVARLAYRGAASMTVTGRVVFESDLATPDQSGVVVPFAPQTVPTGYSPLYLASFSPTREGKYYVYIKSVPSGGEGLIIISAFNTLPYSRAAGTIKSSASSTVT